MCSQYANHSRLNSQHDWKRANLPLSEHESHHFHNEEDIQISSSSIRQSFGLANHLKLIAWFTSYKSGWKSTYIQRR